MQNLQNNKKRRIINSNIAFYASIITLIGLFFLSYNFIMSKKAFVYALIDPPKEVEVVEEKKEEVKEEPTEEQVKEEKEEDTDTYDSNYIGYLKIPKIGLEKAILDKNSPDNDVEKNLYTADISTYPDKTASNLVLAGHSGTGWKAFFNELYQLNINDIAIVNYKNKDYTYKLVNIYKQPKNGTVRILRDVKKKCLTLITCTNGDDTTQTVYIFELA